jgi:uncharacterized membrane protein
MTTMAKPTKAGLLNIVAVVVAAAVMVPGIVSQDYSVTQYNGTYPGNLVLNVFIDESGRALVTGYADSIVGLPFLNGSQYKYDKDTKQLYALTNSLTYKSGDEWKALLFSQGTYSEYHSIFYLPTSAKISNIASSKGLDYLVSASNDSFQVDLHGYDVLEPNITIDYQLPLQESAATGGSNTQSIKPIALLIGLTLASAALFVWTRKRGEKQSPQTDPPLESPESMPEKIISQDLAASEGLAQASNLQAQEENKSTESGYYFVSDNNPTAETNHLPPESDCSPSKLDNSPLELDNNPLEQDGSLIELDGEQITANDEQFEDGEKSPTKDGLIQAAIKISSEMAAVMETLTARERAVISALIENGGKMNQADIRYETRIPKSSLTGILMSLERRKLIIKKEKGRTNAIELSEWFLSKKD